jgi:hypothetical protein
MAKYQQEREPTTLYFTMHLFLKWIFIKRFILKKSGLFALVTVTARHRHRHRTRFVRNVREEALVSSR